MANLYSILARYCCFLLISGLSLMILVSCENKIQNIQYKEKNQLQDEQESLMLQNKFDNENISDRAKLSFDKLLLKIDQFDNIDSKNQLLKIALLLPLTGDYAQIGQDILNAFIMCLSQLEQGGEHISLIPIDVNSTALEAINAIEDVVEKGIKIVIGPVFSEQVSAISDIVENNNITLFTFSNNSKLKLSKNIISFGLYKNQEVEAFIDYMIYKRKYGVYASVSPASQLGSKLTLLARNKIIEGGGELFKTGFYNNNNKIEQTVESVFGDMQNFRYFDKFQLMEHEKFDLNLDKVISDIANEDSFNSGRQTDRNSSLAKTNSDPNELTREEVIAANIEELIKDITFSDIEQYIDVLGSEDEELIKSFQSNFTKDQKKSLDALIKFSRSRDLQFTKKAFMILDHNRERSIKLLRLIRMYMYEYNLTQNSQSLADENLFKTSSEVPIFLLGPTITDKIDFTALNGTFISLPKNSIVEKFNEYFSKIYGYEPTYVAALSYDLLFTVLNYINQKKFNIKKLTLDMDNNKLFLGVIGKFYFKDYKLVRDMLVHRVVNAQPRYIKYYLDKEIDLFPIQQLYNIELDEDLNWDEEEVLELEDIYPSNEQEEISDIDTIIETNILEDNN